MTAAAESLPPGPVTLLAVGKAAAPMAAAFARTHRSRVDAALVVSTHVSVSLPSGFECHIAGHPLPNEASERAGRRALQLASEARGPVVLLLSGGASALMAVPRAGVDLQDKRAVTTQLLRAGADIHALNTVRKHLSAVKGGWLAAAATGPTIAFAVSDVVDNDLSVIGSGPTVADRTTFADALRVLDGFGGRTAYPRSAVRVLESGLAGELPDTPKPGDSRLSRASTRIIGSRLDVMNAAAEHAARAGYAATIIGEPIVGDARRIAPRHVERMAADAAHGAWAAVISTGETTVRVVGDGRGGRNQELVLAAAPTLAALDRPAAFASVGTDGIDGPTDAAGGVADTTTVERARLAAVSISDALARNDSYPLLDVLGDLVRTGPTGTNVGDLQLLLIGPGEKDQPRGDSPDSKDLR